MALPAEIVQLGVAGIVAMVLAFVLKLIVDGRLHTDGEIRVRDDRIIDLMAQTSTLTTALGSANDQSKAIISLWSALQSGDRDG